MRCSFFIVIIAICCGINSASMAQPSAASNNKFVTEKSQAEEIEAAIVQYTNAYRQQRGLPAFIQITSLNKFAREHSAAMAAEEKISHDDFENRVKAVYAYANKPIKGGAENVAMGYLTAEEVVNGWIKSPGHHKNLLSNHTHLLVGVQLADNGNWYFTQIFITL
jgi:uncharacterized protein YkwD